MRFDRIVDGGATVWCIVQQRKPHDYQRAALRVDNASLYWRLNCKAIALFYPQTLGAMNFGAMNFVVLSPAPVCT
jgi:hypothetical protein